MTGAYTRLYWWHNWSVHPVYISYIAMFSCLNHVTVNPHFLGKSIFATYPRDPAWVIKHAWEKDPKFDEFYPRLCFYRVFGQLCQLLPQRR